MRVFFVVVIILIIHHYFCRHSYYYYFNRNYRCCYRYYFNYYFIDLPLLNEVYEIHSNLIFFLSSHLSYLYLIISCPISYLSLPYLPIYLFRFIEDTRFKSTNSIRFIRYLSLPSFPSLLESFLYRAYSLPYNPFPFERNL